MEEKGDHEMKIVMMEGLGITEEKLESYLEPLRKAGHEIAVYMRNDDIKVQMEQTKDAEVIILANMPLKGEVIRACSKLKYIDVAFTGVDHVDLEAAKECHVAVSNASGYSNEAVAEITICMMLSLLRNFPAVETKCRKGGTKDGLVGSELNGKTVGIIGTGAIGSKVGELCRAFGCKTIAYNGFSHKENTAEMAYLPLQEMMEQSDLVALHCPVTEQSKHLINAETLGYMKRTAYLINEARGPVVDSKALAEALNKEKIAGAAVDVFEMEPPIPAEHPLLNAKNILVTPHVAFATKESMIKRADIVFENLKQWMNGKQKNIILPQSEYEK